MNLKPINTVAKLYASAKKSDYFSLGMEKLDRNAFNPDKAYDKVGKLGVKRVRLQSGWAKTEKQKGVYDFSWLDEQVNQLLVRGIEPWLCLCYGNPLYDDDAKKSYGAVGCPPIYTKEAYDAWLTYCRVLAKRYDGKINYYEIWNEPDNKQCWKRGVNGKEYADFAIQTAKALKSIQRTAKIITGSISCYDWLFFLRDAFEAGLAEVTDAISYHFYTYDEQEIVRSNKALRALCDTYKKGIEILQGETGSQSASGGNGAMFWVTCDEDMQAKHLARRLVTDLLCGVKFTSVFTCVDMNENLDAKEGEVIQQRGYFGVLSADFDKKTGLAIGEYKEKKSYFVLQNLSRLIGADCKVAELPACIYRPVEPLDADTYDCKDSTILYGGFEKKNAGKAFVYWNATDLQRVRDFTSSVSFNIAGVAGRILLVDTVNGNVYELPESQIERRGDNCKLLHIPLKDYPLMLIFGDY